MHKKNGREVIKLETGENFEGRVISVPLTFPNVDDNWKKIKGKLDTTQCSIYHPVGNIEFENFNTILSSIITQLLPETNIILGHNINANVGTSANSRQHLKEMIGAYGIENRNKKGTPLINLMASLNMKITKSFNPRTSNFNATTMHTTWRNPNASKSQHMLDVFLCFNNFFNRVQGCNPTRKDAESDHMVVVLKIHINKLAFKMKDKELATKIDWKKIMNDETTKAIYNKKLEELTNANQNNNDTQEEYTSYFKNVKRTGKETATKTITPPWTGLKQAKTKYNRELTLSPYSNNSVNAKTSTQNPAFKKNLDWSTRYATS